jgi:2-polyprenyl-3-methyl-5-hydroxy-6-metoxy-1,4-benzoquinol methylase
MTGRLHAERLKATNYRDAEWALMDLRSREPEQVAEDNRAAREAWNANAAFWDKRMAEGNDFFQTLLWPAVERLIGPIAGRRVLDAACGNGVTSRRLATLGAQVTAFDFAEQMIAHARERSAAHNEKIDYRVLDAADEAAMLQLGEGAFDAALCNMALMDMADIGPLLRAVRRLLKPASAFVFSLCHPCFNHAGASPTAELIEREGKFKTQYAMKVCRYLTPEKVCGVAMVGQPQLHPYFQRPLGELLGQCFAAGFVLDGLEERSFPPNHPQGTFWLSWSGNFSEIPPALVARLRSPA